jgi:hypothetical protein
VGGIARVFGRSNEVTGLWIPFDCGSVCLMIRASIRHLVNATEGFFDGLFAVFATHSFNGDCRRHPKVTMAVYFIRLSVLMMQLKDHCAFDSEGISGKYI